MFTSLLEDVEHHHRKRVSEERRRRRGMVFRRLGRSDDGVGPSIALPPPSDALGADAAGEDSADDAYASL
jgi:hypothetical protein